MILEELEVRGIRNLRPQLISFPKRVTLIFGQNGQGKTSVLEAIFLLSQNRSFRSTQIRDVVQRTPGRKESRNEVQETTFKEGEACIRGLVRSSLGTREITLQISRGKKTLLLDGKKAQAAGQFFGQLRVVTFTPEELQLVKGAPLLRRQFVDRILSIVDHGYLQHLVHYQRALKQRNALLAKAAGGNEESLLPWEQILAEHGRAIAITRENFLRTITPACQKYYQDLCRPSEVAAEETIGLRYKSDFFPEEEILSEKSALAEYAGYRASDRRIKSTHFGIHRDDVEIVFRSDELKGLARALASQGQTRTIALAMKLAAVQYIEEVTGEPPLLLLDDVESELDAMRREGLFEFLQASQNQVVITTTDPTWAPSHRALDVDAMEIQGGQILGRK